MRVDAPLATPLESGRHVCIARRAALLCALVLATPALALSCMRADCQQTDIQCSPAGILPYLRETLNYNALGELDPDFNGTGFAVHHNAAGGNGADRANALTVAANGSITLAGESFDGGNNQSTIWRFTSSGQLDTTLNGAGFRVRAAAAGANGLFGVRTDASGAIVAIGSADAATTDLSVLRFLANGADDASFAGTGLVLFDDVAGGGGGPTDEARGMTLASDGTILAVGQGTGPSATLDMYLARINTTGGLIGATPHHDAAGGNSDDDGIAVAVDSSGRYVVAGSSFGGTLDMAVWRILPGGGLDTTFNGTGFFTHDNAAGGSASDAGYAIAIDAQGRIVVAGESERVGPYPSLALWRLTPQGQLDPTFGTGGFVTRFGDAGEVATDSSRARGLAIDSRGRILVCGSAINSSFDGDMLIWRFLENGQLDPSFAGGAGYLQHHGAAGGAFGDDRCNALQITADGRIMLAGNSDNSADQDSVVWRLR